LLRSRLFDYRELKVNTSIPPTLLLARCLQQVYGHGTMERYHGYDHTRVLEILQNNSRVRNLLTGNTTNSAVRHIIHIEEGKIDQDQAAKLLKGFEGMGRKLRNASKKLAKNFRSKINSYVYRKGTGREPQTWPLIRKVVLFGPWNVLSTGACLVDLPGVRDANAARAKVAEQYLQNCSQIWIAAPVREIILLVQAPSSVTCLTPFVLFLCLCLLYYRSSALLTMGQVGFIYLVPWFPFGWSTHHSHSLLLSVSLPRLQPRSF